MSDAHHIAIEGTYGYDVIRVDPDGGFTVGNVADRGTAEILCAVLDVRETVTDLQMAIAARV